MGIFNIFKREAPKQEQQSHVVPASAPSDMKPFDTGLVFNKAHTYDAMKLSAVYAALSIISNSIATLPIYVKQHKDNAETILPNHQVQKLFYSMLQSKHTVIKQLVWDMLVYGNSFIYIKRSANNVEKLIYLQHGDVQVNYRKELGYIEYNVCNHNEVPSKVKQEDILHFARDTYDGVNGRGFLYFASEIIKLAGFTQAAAEDFFGSGCNLTGVLSFKGRLLDKQKEAIRQQWMMLHGAGGSGGLGVLEGDAEYKPIAQNSANSQMLESRVFNITEIARFFNISPILLGDLSHNSYSSIEDSNIEFVNHTLLPIINLLEEEINRKLITNNNNYVDFDENYLLKGNRATMADYYTKLTSNGILTINESRNALGYNSMEGGDELIIPFTDIAQNTVGGTDDINDENITPEE